MGKDRGPNHNRVVSFLGIGSNLGEPLNNCREALVRIARIPGIEVKRRSSFFLTEPVSPIAQDWFVNAVAEIGTCLPPGELLASLKMVEEALGRRGGELWGPRVIDLDILLYGHLVWNEEGLKIPHPELHRRRFVMVPLMEIAPYLIHPAFGVSIAGLMGRLKDDKRVLPMEDQRGELN